jgi:hypothetical protein
VELEPLPVLDVLLVVLAPLAAELVLFAELAPLVEAPPLPLELELVLALLVVASPLPPPPALELLASPLVASALVESSLLELLGPTFAEDGVVTEALVVDLAPPIPVVDVAPEGSSLSDVLSLPWAQLKTMSGNASKSAVRCIRASIRLSGPSRRRIRTCWRKRVAPARARHLRNAYRVRKTSITAIKAIDLPSRIFDAMRRAIV